MSGCLESEQHRHIHCYEPTIGVVLSIVHRSKESLLLVFKQFSLNACCLSSLETTTNKASNYVRMEPQAQFSKNAIVHFIEAGAKCSKSYMHVHERNERPPVTR